MKLGDLTTEIYTTKKRIMLITKINGTAIGLKLKRHNTYKALLELCNQDGTESNINAHILLDEIHIYTDEAYTGMDTK